MRSSLPEQIGFVAKRNVAQPLPMEPWKPAAYDKSDIFAFQALARGEATPHQQQRALSWIMYASGIDDLPYVPGQTNDTNFAVGRTWVARQVRKLLALTLNLEKLEPKDGE
jgi:hypothetical protein